MKKNMVILITITLLGIVLVACSAGKKGTVEPKLTTKEMIDQMVEEIEQPAQIELQPNEVKDFYHLDPEKLEEYSIRIPMMNIKTNEIAILKVKDSKEVADVETAVKQRAEDVKKQFETYLPDQYENAKNYKLVTKGNYVLLVISEKADDLVEVFNSFFSEK